MRKLTAPLASLILFTVAAPARADDGPTILKQSIVIQARRMNGPKDNVYLWLPKINFVVVGPVPSGGVFLTEFGAGKTPWVTVNIQAPELADGAIAALEGGYEVPEGKKATTTGEIPFRIRYKNELTSADQVVFSGKLDVRKIHPPGLVGPNFKSTVEFYVDYDADLPLAFLWWNYRVEPKRPPLMLSMWFRGATNAKTDVAYVFYKGKQVSKTDDYNQGVMESEWSVSTGNTTDCNWTFARLHFGNLRATIPDASMAGPGWLDLSKNPGEYEVKVLRSGKLSRVAKFSVGDDGQLVDNGLAAKNKLGGTAILVPVKLLLDTDGGVKVDKTAWKKGALYGNPPEGFVAP